MRDAVKAAQGAGIDVVVCTIAFDESRMLELLEALKHDPRTKDIPFVCCRVLPTILSNQALGRMEAACLALGASAYVDIPTLEGQHGASLAAVKFKEKVSSHTR